MLAKNDWDYPGRWAARAERGMLTGKWRYAVCLNNHTDVAWFETLRAAELDAAKRNYEKGSYSRPAMLGL